MYLVYGEAPTRWLHSIYQLRSLEVATLENEIINFHTVVHMQESPPREQFLVRPSSPFMRLAEHLTAPHAWYKQWPPGRGKPEVFRPDVVGM